MSNKIIHFFRFFSFLFIGKNFFSSLSLEFSFAGNLLSFISKTVVMGLLVLDKELNKEWKRKKFPLIFNFSCHSTTKEQKSGENFLPIIQSPQPSYIEVCRSREREERLKNVLTYFQMKYNIFPQFVCFPTCFKLFFIFGNPQKTRH